jgi:hypothetical protein
MIGCLTRRSRIGPPAPFVTSSLVDAIELGRLLGPGLAGFAAPGLRSVRSDSTYDRLCEFDRGFELLIRVATRFLGYSPTSASQLNCRGIISQCA